MKIDGVLFAMVGGRTNNAKSIINSLRSSGYPLRVFSSEIPESVKAAESNLEGKSIFSHDKGGKAAAAYEAYFVSKYIALPADGQCTAVSDRLIYL